MNKGIPESYDFCQNMFKPPKNVFQLVVFLFSLKLNVGNHFKI